MADDKNDKPSLLRRAWAFGKLKLNHPPPRSAAPPFPQLQLLTPGGLGPSGAVRPVAYTRTELPRAQAADRVAAKTPAEKLAIDFRKAARTPEETARLERGATLRRDMLAEQEARAREGLAKANRAEAERLQQQLDDAKAEPTVRVVAEAAMASKQAADAQMLDEHFVAEAATTDAAIALAFETGAFSDALEAMLSTQFDRVAGNELGHSSGDDGGRAIGD